jgi:hypothetical protein
MFCVGVLPLPRGPIERASRRSNVASVESVVPIDSFVSILTEHKFGERERGVSESMRRLVPASLQVVVE